jgi:hypothetical protein
VGGMDVVAAVLRRGAHPVAAFAHRRIGQADGVKIILIGLDAGDVNLTSMMLASMPYTAALKVL